MINDYLKQKAKYFNRYGNTYKGNIDKSNKAILKYYEKSEKYSSILKEITCNEKSNIIQKK